MFDMTLSAWVRAIKVKMKETTAGVVRRCTVVLERDFDAALADSLGGEARSALLALESGGMESCVLPIDAIIAMGAFSAGQGRVEGVPLKGIKATAKAGDAEDETAPSIALELEFPWNPAAWTFFGAHCGVLVELTLAKVQPDLPGVHRLAGVAVINPRKPRGNA